MYVPGQLSDVDTVLVDIGTGYYVDMVSINAACLFVFVLCHYSVSVFLSLSLRALSLSVDVYITPCVHVYGTDSKNV